MLKLLRSAKGLSRRTPALLLLGVYFFIFFVLLSYDHAWMQPEEFSLKSGILQAGSCVSRADLQRGLNFRFFEYAPRYTRPLSNYFEIINTKFRAWLWDHFLPHPSLSLTWIFSLILSPWLLYRFLRNFRVSADVAMCAVCLYLLNPGFLSSVVMLFRPAKAMANFSIILCLYLGSYLHRRITKDCNGAGEQSPDTAPRGFISLAGVIFFSFFWDETALVIYPAMILFFPRLFMNAKRLIVYALLPPGVYLSYYYFFPWISAAAGYPNRSGLTKYIMHLHPAVSEQWRIAGENFFINSQLLISDSLGIVPVHLQAPAMAKIFQAFALLAILFLTVRVLHHLWEFCRDKKVSPRTFLRGMAWGAGLLALLASHNYLMALVSSPWGLYWYGAYCSVFFVIGIAWLLQSAQIPRPTLVFAVGLILLNMGNVFIETNKLVKKYHYYPCDAGRLVRLFNNEVQRFDPSQRLPFSGSELRTAMREYWEAQKVKGPGQPWGRPIPKELFGVVIECEPGQYRFNDSFLSYYKYDIQYEYSWFSKKRKLNE